MERRADYLPPLRPGRRGPGAPILAVPPMGRDPARGRPRARRAGPAATAGAGPGAHRAPPG
eukprot:4227167-Lingulodinium_polyedra.AAC.1